MAKMTYFMSPECENSKRQKELLEQSGNTLDCKDLIFYNWNRAELLPYVRGREPLHVMNLKHPDIQQGRIDPVLLTIDEALDLMVSSPSLIKGPLTQVDNLYIQGNEDPRLNRYLSTEQYAYQGKNTLKHGKKRYPISKKSFGESFHPFWGSYYACTLV